MPRDPEEKARFRGNDALYQQNWDHIFGKKKEQNEEAPNGNETRSDGTLHVEGQHSGHSVEDVDRSCADNA